MELLAHTVACLPYSSLDGPLFAIHAVAAQVPMLGTIALQGNEWRMKREEGSGAEERGERREERGGEQKRTESGLGTIVVQGNGE